jgi:hypothetical protein
MGFIPWFTLPLGGALEQINTFVFFNLGLQLQTCYFSAFMPLKVWIQSPILARQALKGMLAGDVKFKLDESRDTAEALLPILQEIIDAHAVSPESQLVSEQVSRFNAALFAFHAAIQLELGRAPIFYVTSKGVYETRRLISDAAAVFEGYRDRLPEEAIADTNQAGRCLAFELPTAAGFHIARATEATIKKYMDAYGCTPFKESQRNWGQYIKALEEKGANAKITQHLTQLKDLHRNPVTHPEVTLTMPEAIQLWALCTSAMQAMVGDIEKKSPKPAPEIAAMAPPPPYMPWLGGPDELPQATN